MTDNDVAILLARCADLAKKSEDLDRDLTAVQTAAARYITAYEMVLIDYRSFVDAILMRLYEHRDCQPDGCNLWDELYELMKARSDDDRLF